MRTRRCFCRRRPILSKSRRHSSDKRIDTGHEHRQLVVVAAGVRDVGNRGVALDVLIDLVHLADLFEHVRGEAQGSEGQLQGGVVVLHLDVPVPPGWEVRLTTARTTPH